MMKRIKELQEQGEMSRVSEEKSNTVSNEGTSKTETVRLEANLERIQCIEEALTRVQTMKIRLLQEKFDVLTKSDKENDDTRGVLRELSDAIRYNAKLRNDQNLKLCPGA